jgi:DNA-binding PadR family transcriptional regulator
MSSLFRGFLRIVVLKALSDGSQSGYSLMKHIQENTGTKPSPGSMYPLLSQLAKEGFLTGNGTGRKTEYALTKNGKLQLNLLEEKRSEILLNHINGMKMLSSITGEDMTFPITMVESIRRGIIPFKEINPEWDELRTTLFTMMQKGKLAAHAQKIKRILSKTIKEINK